VSLKHQRGLIKKYIFVGEVGTFGVCMVYINSRNFGLESLKKKKRRRRRKWEGSSRATR